VSRDWEDTFRLWAKPPGQTEQDKCDHAETAIRKAIQADETLAAHNITAFPQGSYRNRTNVRLDSDVDICILCRDTFFYRLPDGTAPTQFGITPETYSYPTFKNDVDRALKSYLGAQAVTRGNKAFDIHENTYRIDADALAAFEYRWYRADGSWLEGTSFLPDRGGQVVNWPEQNYQNGVRKNDATGRGFKGVVRILKRLKGEMVENGLANARPIPSFLIECLAWNVPDTDFTHNTWAADLRAVLLYLFNGTLDAAACQDWCEINDIKDLFHSRQPWTREATHAFIIDAWSYIGFQ